MLCIQPGFQRKKRRILDGLAKPKTEYTDLSPKGSVDKGIQDLIEEINRLDGIVTTSSCAGRISVYLEGRKESSKKRDYGHAGEQDRRPGEISQHKPQYLGVKGRRQMALCVSRSSTDALWIMSRRHACHEVVRFLLVLLSRPSWSTVPRVMCE
jgi:hypothetical protein